jgi:hypothetical protein
MTQNKVGNNMRWVKTQALVHVIRLHHFTTSDAADIPFLSLILEDEVVMVAGKHDP